MRALLHLDRGWIFLLSVIGVAMFSTVCLDQPFVSGWVFPSDRFVGNALLILWPAAMILGFLIGCRDQLERTTEYLIHRPLHPSRIFASRVVAGGLILAAWIVLPLLVWMASGLASPNSALAEWGRFFEYLALDTIGLPALALGLLTALLPGFLPLRLIVGSVVSLGVMSASYRILQEGRAGLPLFVTFNVLSAGALLVAARRCFVAVRDSDRPFSGAWLSTCGVLIGATSVIAAGVGLCLLQDEIQRELSYDYPQLFEVEPGRVELVAPDRTSWKGWFLAGEDHALRDEPVEIGGRPTWGVSNLMTGVNPFWLELDARWRDEGRRILTGPWGSAWLDAGSGQVDIVTLAPADGSSRPSRRRVARPDGAVFSPEASAPEDTYRNRDRSRLFIGDPADGTIWELEPGRGDTAFRRVELPGGDVFVDWITRYDWSRGALRDLLDRKDVFAVEGRNAIHLRTDQGFETLDGAVAAEAVRAAFLERVRVDTLDPVTATVHAHDENGKEIFSHEFLPRTGRERALSMALHAASFLRSPFLGVVSYLRPSPLASYRNAVLIDPLLAGGKRSGFLLALLGVGYGLAWEIHRRLRKRGAPASRAFFWAALVFLGGVSVYIVSFLVETPGAYRKVRLLRDEEAPRCLLRSSLTLPPQPENVS